jgi:hypothetical protein
MGVEAIGKIGNKMQKYVYTKVDNPLQALIGKIELGE